MAFSLSSYILGVGTIVGALAFGVGTGALMTKSALLKGATAAAPSRVERGSRSLPSPAAAPQVAEPRENPAQPAAATPATEAAAALHPDPASSVQPEQPKADTRSEAAEKPPEPTPQGGLANQQQALQEKPAERRVQRAKHYAARRTRRGSVAAVRPLQPDEQDPHARPDLVYVPDQPQRGFFRTFSPPPPDRSDVFYYAR
jgi:type IV secretory pathway VirB10-like protein